MRSRPRARTDFAHVRIWTIWFRPATTLRLAFLQRLEGRSEVCDKFRSCAPFDGWLLRTGRLCLGFGFRLFGFVRLMALWVRFAAKLGANDFGLLWWPVITLQ